jgi:hypothetical protein
MKKIESIQYDFIQETLSNQTVVVHNGDKPFTDFYQANTFGSITDHCFDVMDVLPYNSLRLYIRSITLLSRNPEPTASVVVKLSHKIVSDIMSRNTYYKALSELKTKRLLLDTPKQGVFMINVQFYNRMYNTSKQKIKL